MTAWQYMVLAPSATRKRGANPRNELCQAVAVVKAGEATETRINTPNDSSPVLSIPALAEQESIPRSQLDAHHQVRLAAKQPVFPNR